jgi:cystathionine gamma-synthase/cystathionine gamma-lyase/cystathionine beta-lyase
MHIDTLLIHGGELKPRPGGAVSFPIFQSSTFEEAEVRGYHDVRYARLSNTPTHEALHARLAALEGAQAGLAVASGMAAITVALLSSLRSGDHLLAQQGLYGGTHDLLTRDLRELGIETTFVSGDSQEGWRRALRPNTRVFYLEGRALRSVSSRGWSCRFTHPASGVRRRWSPCLPRALTPG